MRRGENTLRTPRGLATEIIAAEPDSLAEAWLDTSFSDGTELVVNLERALEQCQPEPTTPAAHAAGELSAAAAAGLAVRATLLYQ